MKIIVAGGWDITNDQKDRLARVGQVSYVAPDSLDELLTMVKGADVLCSDGSFLLQALPKLQNIFVTYPYIELGEFNTEKLAANGVSVANAQGGNRQSIVEWTMFMIIALFRQLVPAVNAKEYTFTRTQSLDNKRVLIIGKGSIGTEVGKRCEAFGMRVDYFERGDNLAEKVLGHNLFINCLNVNATSKNFLNEDFFMFLPKGSYYISFVRPWTYHVDAMIKSLDGEILAGAAIDCDPEGLGDTKNVFYKKVAAHPKILATPHIAGATVQASVNGSEIAIQNVEAFAAGKPQNVLSKK